MGICSIGIIFPSSLPRTSKLEGDLERDLLVEQGSGGMGFRQRQSKSMSEFKGETLIPTWKLVDGSKSYTLDHRTLYFPRLMHTHHPETKFK